MLRTPPLGAENSCKRGQRTILFGLCQVQPNLEKLKKSLRDFYRGIRQLITIWLAKSTGRRPLPLRGGSGGAASGGHKRMAEPAKQAKPLKIKNNASHESCRGHGVARDYFVFLSQNVFGIDVNGQPFQYVHAHAGVPQHVFLRGFCLQVGV